MTRHAGRGGSERDAAVAEAAERPRVTFMRRSALALSLAALGLVVAACGGDDSDSVLDRIGTPQQPESAPDEPGTDTPADDPVEAPSAPATPEQLGEVLDELGLDLDDLSDLGIDLGDLGDLDLSDLENLDLEELFGGLDDFISGFGGDGGGVVTVAGVRYEITSDSCVTFGPEFYMDGPAQGSDGSVAWIDASRSIATRTEMAEFLDESMLDMMFGDADEVDELYLGIQVGATGRFDFVDDQPNWTAGSDSGFAVGIGVVEFEFFGNGVRGAGEAHDSNLIATGFGETVPIEFEFACN